MNNARLENDIRKLDYLFAIGALGQYGYEVAFMKLLERYK